MEVDGSEITLMLWDVAGEEDDAPVNLKYVRGASGYLLVVDGPRPKTLDAALKIQQRVETEFGRRPFVRAGQQSRMSARDGRFRIQRSRNSRHADGPCWKPAPKRARTWKQAFLTLATAMLKDQDDGEDDD